MQLRLRSRELSDATFVRDLFVETRSADFALLPDELRDDLVTMQHDAFEASLRAREGLHDEIVEVDGSPVGRLVVDRGPLGWWIVDLAILASARRHGIGTLVIARVLAKCESRGLPLRFHVRSDSAARRLYERLGFVVEASEEPFLTMVRAPSKASTPLRAEDAPHDGSSSDELRAFLHAPGVVPTRVVSGERDEVVLLALGACPFREAFFDESVAACVASLGRAPVRRTVPLAELARATAFDDAVPLAGLVFHVSRCGSTLVTRALASDERTHVVAEAPPIDFVLTRARGTDEERAALLRGFVRAYARRRTPRTERLVLKLDAWHLRSLPFLRSVFPDVPFVIVVRDPLEILASHRVRRGSHVVPGLVDPGYLGVGSDEFAPHELDRYACLVLRGLFRAARDGLTRFGGLLVRYDELPQTIVDTVAPQFGVPSSSELDDGIRGLAHAHAKRSHEAFRPDSEEKRDSVPAEVRALVDALVRPDYDALLASR